MKKKSIIYLIMNSINHTNELEEQYKYKNESMKKILQKYCSL